MQNTYYLETQENIRAACVKQKMKFLQGYGYKEHEQIVLHSESYHRKEDVLDVKLYLARLRLAE